MLKRIALLTNFVPPYRVSVFQYLQQRSKDFQVFISAPMEADRKWPVYWADLRVRVQRSFSLRCGWSHPNRFTDKITLHFPYDTIPALVWYSPDVVISGEMGARTLQAAAYCALAPRARLIIWATLSEITEQNRGAIRGLLRRVLLRSADAVLVNGESGKRYVRAFGVEPKRIFRVPQTVDIEEYLAIPDGRPSEKRRRILICGQLIERKGILPFVEHAERWACLHPGELLEVWIAGDGPLREELSALKPAANFRLKLLGNIEYSELSSVYAECGLLAFPTLADEWGLVVVEAMAAGLPILGSLYSQAVEDLVSDGSNGWTFLPDRPNETIQALDRALTSTQAELDAMGICARKKVREMTPAVMADQIITAVDTSERDD